MSKHGTPGSFFNVDVNENTPPLPPTEDTPTPQGGLAHDSTLKASGNQVGNLHLLLQGKGTQTACTCGKSFWAADLAYQHQTLMNSVVLERERRRLDTTAAGNDMPKYDPEADIKDTLRRKGEHKKQELERGK